MYPKVLYKTPVNVHVCQVLNVSYINVIIGGSSPSPMQGPTYTCYCLSSAIWNSGIWLSTCLCSGVLHPPSSVCTNLLT